MLLGPLTVSKRTSDYYSTKQRWHRKATQIRITEIYVTEEHIMHAKQETQRDSTEC